MRRTRRDAIVIVAAWALAAPALAADPLHAAPEIRPAAIELGLAGAFAALDAGSRATLDLRGTGWLGAPIGVLGLGAGCGFTHVAELDRVEILGSVRWEHAVGDFGAAASVATLGGWSEEWIGSFSQAHYPFGFSAGLRWLPSHAAALRVDARWLRYFNDPVDDPTELQVLFGLSILFRNAPQAPP